MIPASFSAGDGRLLRLTEANSRRGGQALVYQARLDGKLVAVKVYNRVSARADAERRILEEIARDDATAPEWLVTVLGSGEVNGLPFLVLPWMDASLTDWAEGRPLADRVEALVSATEAVARLHRSHRQLTGYRVHRDIKPDNLLVSWEGRWVVRLADLGAAKDGLSMAHTANTGVLTEQYAPPEQALPVAQEPRESWDVHAMAVTIFWGITRRMPVPALDAPGLLNADGRTLVKLARRGEQGSWNDEERAAYARLKQKPAEDLLELDMATGWRADDTAHLERAFEDAGVTDRGAIQALANALRGALEPDWRRRDNDVRKLLSALKPLATRLGRSEGSPLPVVEAASRARADQPVAGATISLALDVDPPTKRGGTGMVAVLAGVGGLGMVALAVVVVLGVGVWWVFGRGDVAVAEVADAKEIPTIAQSQPEAPIAKTAEPTAKDVSASVPTAPSASDPAAKRSSTPAAGSGRKSTQGSPGPAVPSSAGGATGASGASEAVVAQPAPDDPMLTEPPKPSAAPAAATRSISIAACPPKGATVTVDEEGPIALSGFGVPVTVTEGSHTFTWRLGGEVWSRSLDPGSRKRLCHAFTQDPSCGTCTD